MAGKTKKEPDTQKKRLEKKLIVLLPEIEEEGLIFLIKQAHVLIHNQRIDAVNQEMEELESKNQVGQTLGTNASGGFTIDIETPDNGKTYHFIVNNRKHFLDTEETRKIVELCYRPPTKSSALKYLYQFFHVERDEILYEHEIASEKSPFFEVLFHEVRARFSL